MLPLPRMSRLLLVLALLLVTALAAGEARDPPALTSQTQWVFDLRWDRGDVFLVGVSKRDMPAPVTTPRAVGRFAIELTEHGTLVERVRFDFPGLGVPDPDGGIRMTARLRTRIGVFFPATSRGDKLELIDRTTSTHWALPWPPNAAPADAGASTDGG
jgi:hypothetical protein